MKISITRLVPTIKSTVSNGNILAYASIRLENENQEPLITINGFIIRRSNFETKPHVMFPSSSMGMGKGFFKYTLVEKSLRKEIEEAIIQKFREDIPIVEE